MMKSHLFFTLSPAVHQVSISTPSQCPQHLSLSLYLDGWQRVAACCVQANYLHNYDLPLNHMILYLGVGN